MHTRGKDGKLSRVVEKNRNRRRNPAPPVQYLLMMQSRGGKKKGGILNKGRKTDAGRPRAG